MFTGEQHAPMPLSDSEQAALDDPQKAVSWAAQHDMPDWLRPELERSLGAELAEICEQSKSRAPIFLRVNLRKASLASVQDELARDNIQCLTVDGRKTALQVIENPRRLANSQAYLEGRIELQDAHSQAICAALPAAGRVLDYCAGGGGKILAYAALNDGALFAHDANAGRLADLSHRAKRGGHKVKILSNSDCRVQAPFDLVVCDVPCSGSGSWRRAPSGKWSLTFDQLEGLRSTQREILQEAARLVRSGGELAYVTCSLLKSENTDQVEWFVEHSSSFELAQTTQYYPSESGDGFFFARLTRRNPAT
ncbi:MAG: RsmB/NOP family class I SAM-dependent RNA methyltransferase [Pseudomonadota bacterium]